MKVSMHIPILSYHAVQDDDDFLSISPDMFAWQMAWLAENRYQVISLSKIGEVLDNANRGRTAIITFDDGFECIYQNALPILNYYGFSATVFLVSEFVGKHNQWPGQPKAIQELSLLNWEQVREMDKQNIEFGSHTMTHPRMDRISENEIRYEISESKKLIENQLDHSIQSFAYPYGRFTPLVKSIAQEYFRTACSTKLGLVSDQSDRLALERIEIGYLRTSGLFSSISNPWFPYYLIFRGWVRKLASRLLNREWE